MPLVEIIRGEQTTDAALAKAFDVTLGIKKTPIVVNDSRGFFTSRVIGTFINEGVAMLAEGIDPQTIEQASSQAGYPAPVLQLMDELTLTLPRKIREETAGGVEAAGGTWTPHPSEAVVDRMVDEFDRKGKSSGAGFYEYDDGKRTRLWPGLREDFGCRPTTTSTCTSCSERMLFVEALETVKCVDEGVLTTVARREHRLDLRHRLPGRGPAACCSTSRATPAAWPDSWPAPTSSAAKYGERFEVPQSLRDRAAKGESATAAA